MIDEKTASKQQLEGGDIDVWQQDFYCPHCGALLFKLEEIKYTDADLDMACLRCGGPIARAVHSLLVPDDSRTQ